MKHKALILFFLPFAVSINVNVPENKTTEGPTTTQDFDDLLKLEIEYLRLKLRADGEKKKLPTFEQMCYNAHQICTGLLDGEHLICAQHPKHGLIDFPNICELRFQNCLAKSYEDRTGKNSSTGIFYYNGERKSCKYYLGKTLTIEDAVKQYFMEDLEYQINTFEEMKIQYKLLAMNKQH